MDQFQRLIIKGKSAASEYVPLTPLDIYLGHYITGGVYFFLRAPDVERLKGALALALDRHPSFGACMVREAQGIGLTYGAAGAELLIHRSDMTCPNLRSTTSLITEALLAGTPAAGNPVLDYRFNSGRPVASFQLTLFKDGACALSIRHVHSQADGAGAIHFLQNWSRAYRGLPLSPPSGYSRKHIAELATMPGFYPSKKLNIQPRGSLREAAHESLCAGGFMQGFSSANYDNIAPDDRLQGIRDGGSIRLDIPTARLENFVHNCRRNYRLSLSSSDVLHALAWQCFAKASILPEQHGPSAPGLRPKIDIAQPANLRLYTLFDLRYVKSLGIPADYDGSAVLGRCAEMNGIQVRSLPIPRLAQAIQQQLKPFTAEEAHADISYLSREYGQGHLDDDGNYANFVIGAWLECRNASGLIVNDLRRLAAIDMCFDEHPARMETLVSEEINMISIYQNDDGTVTLHYVGERHTLPAFAECIDSTLSHAPD